MNTMSVMQSVPASEAIPMTHQPSVSECLLCQNTFKTATGTDLSSLITKDTHCHEVLAHLLAISSSFQSKEANKPRVCGTCLFQLIKYWEYHQMIEAIRQDVQSKVDLRRIQELYPPLETPDVVSSDQKAGP
ncbi:hypothetical protein TCAL_04044 [Tigriopus californicus]|uniref:ZAD domain-containing protein n=1 Tax=Tigriopus californicus TaxID=6832 RepID=A0A553PID3_TIGCA|nr:hypothetical protein TCAL_04044 [Tigriopus californicus]